MSFLHSFNPWIAVNLSMLWPGLGQLYCRAMVKGVSLAIATIGVIYYAGWSIFAPNGNTVTGLLLIVLAGILYIFNLFDAYNTVRPLPKASPRDIYQPRQNRWYAIFLSQILPGFGHLYLQKTLQGGIFLVVGVLTAYAANIYPVVLPIPTAIWAIACYHLYRITPASDIQSRQINRTNGDPNNFSDASPISQRKIMIAMVVGLMVIRLTFGYIPTWVSQNVLQCIVPSVSMEPTLQIGDRMFVGYDSNYRPQPKDLVVFYVPADAIALLNVAPDTLFVKRIVGLPNQTVEIRNGQVLINNAPLVESYTASAPRYTLGPVTVPPNAVLVLGDNRNESADSHVWGFLPINDIVGKAYKIYWPPQRIQSLN